MDALPFVDYQYPASGASGALLAFIGEAPGADEVRQGRPFAGRSGQLLDEMLEKADIDRRACLIGNVFRFRPPDNKVDHFFASRGKAKKMGVGLLEELGPFGESSYCLAEYAPEIEHLRATLAELQPAAIVALGRTPMWALTGRNGITALRGEVLPCRFLPQSVVIPTYHPSFILRRNRVDVPTVVDDIKLAMKAALERPRTAAPA
ncbi:MAG TPA: uracil-DNA glycosylase [Stellaceae bacterium]